MSVSRISFLSVILGALVLTALPVRSEERKARSFAVGSVTLEARLPASAKLVELRTQHEGIRIDFRPGGRQPHQIDITRGADPCGAKSCDQTRRMRNGMLFKYRTETSSGGSGGEEAYLDGTLTVKGETFRLACRTQSEWSPRPEWCLDIFWGMKSR